MADEKDTGGSSAGEGTGDRRNEVLTDEQSGISGKDLRFRVNWPTQEKVLYDWISKDSSGEESEPEVNRFEQSVRPGQVKEKMLQMLGVDSIGPESGSGGSVLEDFGIETNIEGLLDRLGEIVRRESCAADSLEGVAEMFKEADEEEETSMNPNPSESESEPARTDMGCFKQWVSRIFWLVGRGLFSVLAKVGCCANVLHYYLKSY